MATKDRLREWNVVSDAECMLCNKAAESHLLELNWGVNYWKKKDFGQLCVHAIPCCIYQLSVEGEEK